MIARIILGILAIAMVGTGVAFSGVALYLALIPMVEAPAAAALTALTLFFLVAAGATIYLAYLRERPTLKAQPAAAAANSHGQDALVTALTQLANEHPLMAVACAAALGMSDAMKRKG
jgi:hypothetical protein